MYYSKILISVCISTVPALKEATEQIICSNNSSDLPCSSVGWDTGYPKVYCSFPQPLLAKAR